jgi:hypothetical protein
MKLKGISFPEPRLTCTNRVSPWFLTHQASGFPGLFAIQPLWLGVTAHRVARGLLDSHPEAPNQGTEDLEKIQGKMATQEAMSFLPPLTQGMV